MLPRNYYKKIEFLRVEEEWYEFASLSTIMKEEIRVHTPSSLEVGKCVIYNIITHDEVHKDKMKLGSSFKNIHAISGENRTLSPAVPHPI